MTHDYSSLDSFLESIHVPNIQHPYLLAYVLNKYRDEISEGILLEFGVYRGRTLTFIAHKYPNKYIYGFDSFYGLPEDWTGIFKKGNYSTNGIIPSVPSNVTIVKGLFADTLPTFAFTHDGIFASLVHIDCDLYSSTKCIFDNLGGSIIRPGTILVFDQLFNYPDFKNHQFKALYEFLKKNEFDVEWIGLKGVLYKKYESDGHRDYDNGTRPCACFITYKIQDD